MKKNFLLVFVILYVQSFASNRYWVGGSSGAWNNTSSWSTVSNGSSGASVPTISDNAIFDGAVVLGTIGYKSATVDVTGVTITAAQLQINAGISVIFSGTANSVNFGNAAISSNALVLLGYFNDGGNTIVLNGNIAYTFITTISSATISSNVATINIASTAGLQVGQFVTATTIPTQSNTQVAFITAINSATQITVYSITAFTSTPSGALTFGCLSGYTTLSAAAAQYASNINVSSNANITAGTVLTGTNFVTTGITSGTVVTGVSGSTISFLPTIAGTNGLTSGQTIIYYNGCRHTGSGKLVMTGGTSVASSKTINGNNFYAPSLNNIEIGDGTTPAFINISAGLFRITGYFKINSYGWFSNGSQMIIMHDIVNNSVPALIMAANSYVSIYNRSNGFAGVTSSNGVYNSNPTFYFGYTTSGTTYNYAGLSSVVILDKASTVIDSITGSTQTLTVSAPITYGNLNIYNNTTSGTVTFVGGNTTTIKGTLTVYTSGGNGVNLNSGTLVMAPGSQLNIASGAVFNFNKKSVTLQADATGAASINALPNGAANIINDSAVIVQQYIPAGKRAYRFLGHPFNNGIRLRTLTGAINVTGGAGNTALGFTATTTNNPSAYWFNTTASDGATGVDAGWTAFTDLTQTSGIDGWSQYKGINVLVRGAKGTGLDGNSYSPAAVTISDSSAFTAVLNKGTLNLALNGAGTGWNLISNPYPSSINLATPLAGFSGVYVWNAQAAGNNGRGAYQAVPVSGSSVIPMGSAFLVKSTAGGQGLTFNESDKTTGTAVTVFGTEKTGIQLDLLQNGDYYDRLFVFNNAAATAANDNTDLEKLLNPDASFYSLSSDNKQLAIDSRPFTGKLQIPVALSTKLTGDFTISFASVNINEGKLYLHDKLNDVYVEMVKDSSYTFTVSDAAATKGERFEITNYAKLTGMLSNNSADGITVYNNGNNIMVNYSSSTPQPTSIRLVSLAGQALAQKDLGIQQKGQYQINADAFTKGMYVVEVQMGAKTITQKIIR